MAEFRQFVGREFAQLYSGSFSINGDPARVFCYLVRS